MKKDIRILLVIINVLLFAALILLALWGRVHWQKPEPVSPVLSQQQRAVFLDQFNLKSGAYPQITARPLFWPSRKPVPEKVPEKKVVTQPNPFDGATLLGTFFDQKNGGAIIRLNKTKEVVRLERGQTYKGWKLEDVSPISALFTDGNKHQKTIQLEQQKQPNQPPPPAGKSNGTKGQGGALPYNRWVPNEPPPKK